MFSPSAAVLRSLAEEEVTSPWRGHRAGKALPTLHLKVLPPQLLPSPYDGLSMGQLLTLSANYF